MEGDRSRTEVTAKAAPEAGVEDTRQEAKQGSGEAAGSQEKEDKFEEKVEQPDDLDASHTKNDQILVEIDSPQQKHETLAQETLQPEEAICQEKDA